MATPVTVRIPTSALDAVTNREALFAFLRDQLRWPVDPDDTFTYAGPAVTGETAARVTVSRLVPFGANDPFIIMLAEFETDFRRTDLREILRAIRREMRQRGRYEGKGLEEVVFVCATKGYQGIRFAHFREQEGHQPRLSVFGWDSDAVNETRTLRTVNLSALWLGRNVLDEVDWGKDTRERWLSAWDVESVTQKFFTDFSAVFATVEDSVKAQLPDVDVRRDFTQRLLNRLMFVHFVSKKKWLAFQGDHRYLRALFTTSQAEGKDRFYSDRLYWLFFHGLGHAQYQTPAGQALPDLVERRGDVPFLNGGLFSLDHEEDVRGAVHIPDAAFAAVLDLFEKYNFTITESTPLDIEVAVDPEMLGKVFEELVTGRHESGSYYTPRPVVSFMCREALKRSLGGDAAAAKLVDAHDPADLTDPARTYEQVKALRVVDPACGSGAYLLGMLQELIGLRRALFGRQRLDAMTDYDWKLSTIERNLYGVDKDPFAVNIARLRLWLSLVVDSETPVALPNLDFKVECGDSLLAPSPQGGEASHLFRHEAIREFMRAKCDFGRCTDGEQKEALRRRIDALRAEIRADTHGKMKVEGFDWGVEFAEVFQGEDGDGRGGGGFDIVLANPPYVRQEEIGPTKPALQKQYAEAVTGKSDLYCYFYVRGLQLLRPGGMHVFVCSNSWLDVDYGGPLQYYLLNHAHTHAIYDSAVERQFATADINTIISVVEKRTPGDEDRTDFVSLRAPFDLAISDGSLCRVITKTRAELIDDGTTRAGGTGKPQYEGGKWGGKFLRAPDIYWKIIDRAGGRLAKLSDLAAIRRGVTSGVNDFFFVRIERVAGDLALLRCDDGSYHEIEAEYVEQPILVKAREITEPHVEPASLAYRLVQLPAILPPNSHAAEYVRWGEASRKDEKGKELGEFHKRQTCKVRKPWYVLEARSPAHVMVPIGHKRRPVVALSPNTISSDNLVEVTLRQPKLAPMLAGCILSAFVVMVYEIIGRANFGQGLLKTQTYEIAQLPVLNPTAVAGDALQAFEEAFAAVEFRSPLMIYDEVRRADRHALDDAFLCAVGFTDPAERADVLSELHDTVCRMIWTRMAKAENTRESRQSYDEWLASGQPFGEVDEE